MMKFGSGVWWTAAGVALNSAAIIGTFYISTAQKDSDTAKSIAVLQSQVSEISSDVTYIRNHFVDAGFANAFNGRNK